MPTAGGLTILLEEASEPASGGGRIMDAASGFLSSSGPGLIFAVYFSPGDGGLIASSYPVGSTYPGGGAILQGTAIEAGGFCTFSGNIGLEVCWLEQAWTAIIESGAYLIVVVD